MTRFLESPQKTYFRMVKKAYFDACLAGRRYEDLPKYETIAVDRALGVRYEKAKFFSLRKFLRYWVNPGFSWKNQDDYLVRTDLAVMLDQMNLGYTFNSRRTLREDIVDWLSLNSIVDLHGQTLFNCLADRVDLPRVIRDRLHLMVESDSIIKEEFLRNPPGDNTTIYLISRDAKLGADLVRLADARQIKIKVYVFRPAFYLVGRLYEFPSFNEETDLVIQDPGAIFFDDITVFCEGISPDWVFDSDLTVKESGRYKDVYVVDREAPRWTKDNEILRNSYPILEASPPQAKLEEDDEVAPA